MTWWRHRPALWTLASFIFVFVCLIDKIKKYVYDIFPNLTSQKQNIFKRSFFTHQTKRLKFFFFFCFCEVGLILDVTLTDDGTPYYFFRTAACELHSLLATYTISKELPGFSIVGSPAILLPSVIIISGTYHFERIKRTLSNASAKNRNWIRIETALSLCSLYDGRMVRVSIILNMNVC